MSLIDLKLDTHTVRNLFPEGTEMRAALQQSVIKNIVKEMVVKDSNNKIREAVYKEIEELGDCVPSVKEAVKTELDKFFVKRGWGGYGSTPELESAMKQRAIETAQCIIQEKISSLINEAAKKLELRIEETLKMSEYRWDQMVTKRINEKFGESLDKAIAVRLAKAFPEVGK